jgi:putative aminopeptidase FrvX
MDTVGLLVKQVSTDGRLTAIAVGGVNLKALPATPVRVGDVPGIIGVRSQHLAKAGDQVVSIEDLYIEIEPAAVGRVEVTTPVSFAQSPVSLGGGLIAGPALDNRAGCAVLVELARRLAGQAEATVYLIGSVQEETTCAGAQFALSQIAPDLALFVDGTVSYDSGETRGRGSVSLGAGPVLTSYLYTSGLNGWHAHQGLRQHLKQTAVRLQLPHQQDAVTGLMSDARTALPLGIPSALIGIPMRGKHSPLETVHLKDLALAADLLVACVTSPLPNLEGLIQ